MGAYLAHAILNDGVYLHIVHFGYAMFGTEYAHAFFPRSIWDICNASVNWNPGPPSPGHTGEFNIYPVLKDGLFPRPRGQETC